MPKKKLTKKPKYAPSESCIVCGSPEFNDRYDDRRCDKCALIPSLGAGATLSIGSDSYAYLIIEVSDSGLKAKIQSVKQGEKGNYFLATRSEGTVLRTFGEIREIFFSKAHNRWKLKGHDRYIVTLHMKCEHMDRSF